MIQKAYTIRDSKSEVFHTPFYAKTHGEAERNFAAVVNDDKTLVGQHPQDFDLFYIGEYNDLTGKFETLETPEHQIKAVQLKKTAEIPQKILPIK